MIIYLKKSLIILYSCYVYLLALILLIPLGPFVFIFSFLNEPKSGNLIYKACHVYSIIWFSLSGIQYKQLNKQPFSPNNQYIFIANHTSYLDVLCLLRAINQPIRALGKQEMAKILIFGYFYKKAVIMVDRSNTTMRAQSIVNLKKIINQKISVFIFPEGTFNETKNPLKFFYDGAFRTAIDTQTSIQPILFLDNNKRMNNKSSFNLLPGKCRVLFLNEISVKGINRNGLEQLKEQVYNAMETELLAYGFTN